MYALARAPQFNSRARKITRALIGGTRLAARSDLGRGDDDHAAHPLRRKGEADIALERFADDGLDHGPAEAGPHGRGDRRPSAFLPDELQFRGLLAELPLD